MAPIPRTSPITGYFSFHDSYVSITFLPISQARSASFSRSIISMVFREAAQASGFPQYVPPMIPGVTFSIISSLAMTALSGRPAAIDFAVAKMSGAHPASFQYSEANILPVRQNPDCTSSATRQIPYLSQIWRTALTHSIGAGINPPSPCRGSTTIAATVSGCAHSSNTFSILFT